IRLDGEDSRQGIAPDVYVRGCKPTPQKLVVGRTLEFFQWILQAPSTTIGQFERTVPYVLEQQQSKGGLLGRNLPPRGVTALDCLAKFVPCFAQLLIYSCPLLYAPGARGIGRAVPPVAVQVRISVPSTKLWRLGLGKPVREFPLRMDNG